MPDGSIYTCKKHPTLRWFDTKPGGVLIFAGAVIKATADTPEVFKQPAFEPGSPLQRLGYYLSNRNPYAPDLPLDEPFTYERLKAYMQFVFDAEAKGYVFECECPARDLTSLPDETYEAIHALPKYQPTT